MPDGKYTSSVGQKFNPDGSTREFPGNTVLCHVPRDSTVFDLLLELRQKAERQPWARKFSFLPPPSYHMTVFDGVCDQVREQAHWSSQLPLDAPLEEVDDLLREAWLKAKPPQVIRMQYRRFYATGGYLTLYLKAASPEVNRGLRNYRDKLSDAIGIRHPNHTFYAFHITLAYGIEVLTPFEQIKAWCFNMQMHSYLQRGFGTLRLKAPELSFFADMAYFAPKRPSFPPMGYQTT